MYCPLCKAEYRAGFDRCSDCHVGLVATRELSEAAKVVLVWEGSNNSLFNDIVAALGDANVPNYARSGAKSERTVWDLVPYVGFFRKAQRMHEQNMWRVFVFETDYPKAQQIIKSHV